MEIEELLFTKENNAYYLYKYIKFIKNCQQKNDDLTGYTEKHHICPKAKTLFPEYSSFTLFPWNMVKLTARQHFIAHWMLARAYGGEMWYALKMMRDCKNGYQERYTIKSGRLYEEIRKNIIMTDETKNKISESQRGKCKSEEHRKKLSKPKSEEHRKKLSKPKSEEHRKKLKAHLDEKRVIPEWSEKRKLDQSIRMSGNENPNYGKSDHNGALELQKIAKSRKGKTREELYGKEKAEEMRMKCVRPKVERIPCIHCKKYIKGPAYMEKFHGNNCKHIKQNPQYD